MLALIGAGYTLQKFKSLYPDYDFFETHRDSLNATEDNIEGDLSFLNSSAGLVFSLPPSAGALNLVKNIKFEKRAVLLSSIGVYAKYEEIITEESRIGESERAQLIFNIEEEFLKNPSAVVLRLGGLFDENRHPVKYIIRNGSTPNGEELVNFVHIDDVCEAIHFALAKQVKHRVYNVVDQNHPSKKEYYTRVARELGNSKISLKSDEAVQYKLSSQRLLNEYMGSSHFLKKV